MASFKMPLPPTPLIASWATQVKSMCADTYDEGNAMPQLEDAQVSIVNMQDIFTMQNY